MLCTKCGKTVPDESEFCPFCGTELERAAAPAPAPAPVATVPVQPQQPQHAPAPTQSSGRGVLIAVIAAVVLVVLVLGGIGAYKVINKLVLRPPVATTADVGDSSVTEPPLPTDATTETTDEMPPPTSPTTETTGETTETTGETPEADASSGGLDLDSYVGTWEFVGEPGPWGEGAPFSLERSGNILVGTAGLPDWDDTVRLQLAAGNDELQGESTTTYSDGETEVMALRMELDASGNLITVKYRGADGEWGIRVARRIAAAGALLMPEGTLEIFVLDGSGGADLLISAYRAGGSS